ncbi:DHHW family protein [Clostridium sp. BJN0001]|uniref:DHHW family protein n=1 Tax=Clostridium sp. BJN0001 TaxID=2930219 RepID=UPI001FD330E9|nr:DHHW family protein [Clostridium sp. BJN0001]
MSNSKKNIRIYSALLTCIFIVSIIFISCVNALKKDSLISEQENRKLQQRPKFSLESFISGDFTSSYTKYLSDQFIGRDFFISLKSRLEIFEGKTESNGVFIGKGHYLIEDFEKTDEDVTEEKINAINKFAQDNKSIKMSFLLSPTATSIWSDKLPKYAPVDSQREYMDSVKSELDDNVKFIDVYDEFIKNKNKDLYYKTDHHWTTDGAFIAYKKMCEDLSIEAKDEDYYEKMCATDNFYGSLYSKIGAKIGGPDSIYLYVPKEDDVVATYQDDEKKIASLYSNDSLDEKDKYQVFTKGNHTLINIKTLSESKKNLLIIKDSYANSFLPFLTPHYANIDVVDLRYYTDNLEELIKSDGITDVLFLYNVNTFNEDSSILNLQQ